MGRCVFVAQRRMGRQLRGDTGQMDMWDIYPPDGLRAIAEGESSEKVGN